MEQIKCPKCGYRMPIYKDEDAKSKGLYVTCKNKKCKHKFEIKI